MKNWSLFWAVACLIAWVQIGSIFSIPAAEIPGEEQLRQGHTGKKITVILTVPDSAWTIAIDCVYQVRGEIWVVSTVSRDPNAIGLQVISTVRDSVEVDAGGNLPVKHFVIGKTWNLGNEEGYIFLKSRREIEKDLQSGKLLYPRAKPAK
jgi:hypothetical protein